MAHTKRVALITGSGRPRLGQAIARDLATIGFSVAVHYYRSDDSAQQLVRELDATGVDCAAYEADVSQQSDVERMFCDLTQRFGRLDALVTTASIWEPTRLEDLTADELRRQFEVNALGTFLCAQRGGLLMARQPEGGSIITVGDWAVNRPYLHHAAYFVSKGTLPTLTRTLAVELATRNPRVRVNCILPGPVLFPPSSTEEQQQAMRNATLVKDAHCPESVAQAVRFFIENQFVTGTCLPVDGGRSIFANEESSHTLPVDASPS